MFIKDLKDVLEVSMVQYHIAKMEHKKVFQNVVLGGGLEVFKFWIGEKG